jgi:hypothetical protein
MENIYDASDDDDEFYTQSTEEQEYVAYLREPVAGKQVIIPFIIKNCYNYYYYTNYYYYRLNLWSTGS